MIQLFQWVVHLFGADLAPAQVVLPLRPSPHPPNAGRMALRALIPEDQVVELAEMFRLMSDPTRLKIILACLDHPAAVGEMAERLSISASLVSHHLRLLRAARLLQADRRGRQVFYVVGDPHIRSMLSDMVDHVAEEDVEVEA